jgi:UDP-N-acetylglucosamine:LPS N-acetylglucosamine transferase
MGRSINPVKDLQAYYKLKALIKEFKPDIVHTHAAKPGALGRLAASACGVPVIVHTSMVMFFIRISISSSRVFTSIPNAFWLASPLLLLPSATPRKKN